jgi:hypothetical protein
MIFAVEESAVGLRFRRAEIKKQGSCLRRRIKPGVDPNIASAALSLYWNFLQSPRQANSDTNGGSMPEPGSGMRADN